jgi:hypothetical protein
MRLRSRRGLALEGLRRTVLVLAWTRSRIETARPFPLVDVDRAAGADRDRADMDVPDIDVPAVRALGISAAGELGHADIEARHWP